MTVTVSFSLKNKFYNKLLFLFYNLDQRYGDDGIHDKLIFDEYKEGIEEFAEKYIISTIVETEIKDNCMKEWVVHLHRHSYEIRIEDDANDKQQTQDQQNDED